MIGVSGRSGSPNRCEGCKNTRTDPAGIEPIGQICRGHALPRPASLIVADHADGQMDLVRVGAERGRDRIEPRLELRQQGDEPLGVGTRGGMLAQNVEQVGGVEPVVFAVSEPRQECRLVGVSGALHEQFEQVVAGAGEVALAQERRADVEPIRSAQGVEQLFHEPRAVLGEDAEGVAGLVAEVRSREVDDDVAGVLRGARPVERPGFDEPSGERVRPAGPGGVGADRGRGFRGPLDGRGEAVADRARRQQFLELPIRLAPAGRALGEVLLGADGDRLGVGLAEITARAAVKLRHRGHELLLDRPPLGQPHPLRERERRVVPGEVLLDRRRRRCRCRRSDVRQRGVEVVGGANRAFPVEAEEPREESVEPGPLGRVERRALGEDWHRHGDQS